MKRNRERLIWAGVTSTLLVAVVILLFAFRAPSVAAQNSFSYNRDVEKYMNLLKNAYYYILNNYVEEVPPEDLFKGAMNGLFESLDDPYSVYLDELAVQNLTDTTEGKFGGVGLYISKSLIFDEENPYGRKPYVEVVSPIEGTPAFRAGIHSGDYIFKINGESAKDLSTNEVSDLLRGTPGTPVDVTILRGESITFDVTLIRANIEIPTVKVDMIDGDIAYMRIIQFTPYTADRIEDALKTFKRNRYKGLIIDLRGNPGGLLSSVVEIADYFFDNGTIVSTKSRIEEENEVFTAKRGTLVDENIPIVVLIDNGSASASEILTGALKDRNRAVVVGQTSYGKGSVQTMVGLGESAIKLTMARYYTPSGVSIDKTGIDPDVPVELPEFTDEELKSYSILLEKNTIREFVQEGNVTDSSISNFISQLKSDNIVLSDNTIRRLINSEVNRMSDNPPVYDMEFDESLQKAVELIKEKL
ncbi:MAG: S41 family peptidase [Spirochaetales bacterium]|nr:S41 family peptidase [Spirochaetales bacterium]